MPFSVFCFGKFFFYIHLFYSTLWKRIDEGPTDWNKQWYQNHSQMYCLELYYLFLFFLANAQEKNADVFDICLLHSSFKIRNDELGLK